MSPIPFNRASLIGKEFEYVQDAIRSRHVCGDGIYTKKCQDLLTEVLGTKKTFLTTSCTDALEMSALLLDIAPGDEVIVPSFTFVTTANAFVMRGARPVFADIRPDTLNLDESKLQKLISPKTKAIVLIHYGGIACEMDSIMEIANKYRLPVVEDNALSLFGTYKGKYLGTFGCLATQSFHETKNFTCGEGGALLINDPAYIKRAEIIREKGTDRSRFFRGEVDKYTWVDLGSSYLPSDILAAFLYAQLEARHQIQGKRKKIFDYYRNALADWAAQQGVALPYVPPQCEPSYHLFYLILPSLEQRQAFITHLKEHGVQAVFHYLPLHLSKMGQLFGGKEGDCPVTEDISDRLVRLPLYSDLCEEDQARIVETVVAFHEI